MTLFRTLILSVMIAAIAVPPQARATAPICADAFSGKSLPRITFLSPLDDLKDILKQVQAARFKTQNYEEALELYRSTEVPDWKKPANREAKLALLQVYSERSKMDPLAIDSLFKKLANNPSELRRLANSVGKLDPQRGFSGLQIESIFLKVYGFHFVSPLGSPHMKEMGVTAVERELLRQWVDREIGTHSLTATAKNLGLDRGPNTKEKFIGWYRDRSLVADAIVKGVVNVMSFYTRGFISPQKFSALGRQKMTDEMRIAYEKGGFDALYPLLKKNFGHLTTFDRRLFLSKRYARMAAMAALLIYFYPTVVQNVMGPEYDANSKSYVQLTEDLGAYSQGVAERFYKIKILGEGGTTTEVVIKTILDKKDSLQLNDGMGPSNDPDPVPVNKYEGKGGRDIRSAHASATQKIIAETESFNRQMNDATEILRGHDDSRTQKSDSRSKADEEASFEAYQKQLDDTDFSEFEPKD